jgi:hypothetical protein
VAAAALATLQATGLAEWLCEALMLISRYEHDVAAQVAHAEASSLAHSRGFGWLVRALEGEEQTRQRMAG